MKSKPRAQLNYIPFMLNNRFLIHVYETQYCVTVDPFHRFGSRNSGMTIVTILYWEGLSFCASFMFLKHDYSSKYYYYFNPRKVGSVFSYMFDPDGLIMPSTSYWLPFLLGNIRWWLVFCLCLYYLARSYWFLALVSLDTELENFDYNSLIRRWPTQYDQTQN